MGVSRRSCDTSSLGALPQTPGFSRHRVASAIAGGKEARVFSHVVTRGGTPGKRPYSLRTNLQGYGQWAWIAHRVHPSPLTRSPRRRPGYPSASCFPAELASVSPSSATLGRPASSVNNSTLDSGRYSPSNSSSSAKSAKVGPYSSFPTLFESPLECFGDLHAGWFAGPYRVVNLFFEEVHSALEIIRADLQVKSRRLEPHSALALVDQNR